MSIKAIHFSLTSLCYPYSATFVISRFDAEEPITHGVEVNSHCEINIDVAEVGASSWVLKTEEEAQTKISGKKWI